MSHNESDAATLGRRELLQRAAVLSGAGAVAWVAPSVMTFGARAAAGTGNDNGDDNGDTGIIGGNPDGTWDFSYIALILSLDGTRYGVKVNRTEGSNLGISWEGSGALPPWQGTLSDGTTPEAFSNLASLENPSNPPLTVRVSDPNLVIALNSQAIDAGFTIVAFGIKEGNEPLRSVDPDDGRIYSGTSFIAYNLFTPADEVNVVDEGDADVTSNIEEVDNLQQNGSEGGSEVGETSELDETDTTDGEDERASPSGLDEESGSTDTQIDPELETQDQQ